MEKLAKALFSMKAMTVALILFLLAIAIATFLESGGTVQTSKLWVYNNFWFELLLVFLTLNLIANIFRYKMWNRDKIAMFTFHISFIVIMIGAGVTRYFGFEGTMPIREGQSSNRIITAEPYFFVHVNNGKVQSEDSAVAYMAESYPNKLGVSDFKIPGHPSTVSFEYVRFQSKMIDSLISDTKNGGDALEIVTNGMQSNFVLNKEELDLGGIPLRFSDEAIEGVNIQKVGDSLKIKSVMDLQMIPMSLMQVAQRSGAPIPDSVYVRVPANTWANINPKTLVQIGGSQFVFKQVLPKVTKKLYPSGDKKKGSDYLTFRIVDGAKSKEFTIKGGLDQLAQPMIFQYNGLNYRVEYGRRYRFTPFEVACIDFELERYPGSMMAASYASDLEIIDAKKNFKKKKHLFMNHVVDYSGYRFFQSSYDEDEKGTVLSVNYDWWGTNISYLGYLLMIIGMVLNLIAPAGRFRELLRKLAKNKAVAASIVLLLFPMVGMAQNHEGHNHGQKAPVFRFMSEEHSDELSELLVQNPEGRIVPYHVMADQLLRKMYRSNKYDGHNAVQVIMSIQMYPDHWMNEKIILVPAACQSAYNLPKYVSFKQLISKEGEYRFMKDYNEAIRLSEVKQSETQKKLIKLTEKFEVFNGIISWFYVKILPVKGDKTNTWYVPLSQDLMAKDSMSSKLVLQYISSIDEASKTGAWTKTSSLLKDVKMVQRKLADAKILPTENHVKTEIMFTKMNIFKNSEYSYLLIGVVLLLVYLFKVLLKENIKRAKRFELIRKVFVFLLIFIFLYHASGLIIRSYLTGDAPWSNGYEALIWIAWVVVLSGLIFTRKHAAILAGVAILAGLFIWVTEMELLDPKITPLQPVLKSYWLKVHVSIITASYGFLGLSCIIGLINLLMYIIRGKKANETSQKITKDINELTYVAEMSMQVGLFMLTIGTFLGGIWANESWGRYWGWDPKETWALVSVLVYAVILHLRFIPSLKGKFLFNLVSFWGYSAILFTFFGVNFILVGLHSYAQGDGSVNLPGYVWGLIAGFFVLTVFAAIKNSQYKKAVKISD